MLSYFHRFSVFVCRRENDSNMVHLDAYFFWKRREKIFLFNNSELTQQDGRGKKTANLVRHVWKHFPPNFTFPFTNLFVKDQKTLMLSEDQENSRQWQTCHVCHTQLDRFTVLLRKLANTRIQVDRRRPTGIKFWTSTYSKKKSRYNNTLYT